MSDFIEIYDNVISSKQCDRIIHLFNRQDLNPGTVGMNRVDTKAKDGLDFSLLFSHYPTDDNEEITETILQPLLDCTKLYRKQHKYIDNTAAWNLEDSWHIQKFPAGGGYAAKHCEQGSSHPFRILVWMIYLNDADCGTIFYEQEKVIDAKPGRLVIWPAAWTHCHSGVMPNTSDKYLATGWYSYEDRGNLHPSQLPLNELYFSTRQ